MPKESVKEAISLIDKTAANPNSGQGDDPSKAADDRTKEQVMAENKRKAEEITALKSQNEEIMNRMEEMQDSLEELKSIRNPTRVQQNAINTMEQNLDSLADELESRQDTQGWVRLSERKAEKVSQDKINEVFTDRDKQEGNWYLEDSAFDLKVPLKELVGKLRPYADKYQDLPPVRRNQLALREWQADEKKAESLTKREKDLEARELQDKLMREGRGRIPIDKEKEDAYEKASNTREKTRAVIDLIGTQTIIAQR